MWGACDGPWKVGLEARGLFRLLLFGFCIYLAYVWQMTWLGGIYFAYVWHSLGGNPPPSVEIATAKTRVPGTNCHT